MRFLEAGRMTRSHEVSKRPLFLGNRKGNKDGPFLKTHSTGAQGHECWLLNKKENYCEF